MSDNIREWARDQGHDIGDKGPISRTVREAFQARDTEGGRLPSDDEPSPETEAVASTTPEATPKQPTVAARAKDTIAKSRTRRGTRGGAAKPKTTKASGPRASVEAILTGLYGAFAGGVGRVNPAVGMIMGVQAPVAGMLLEDSVKGTAVDRLLQPFAKNADRARVGKALFGPPMLVAAISAKPELAPVLLPQLRRMLADYIDLAGPKIVEIQKREAEFEAKYGADVDEIIGRLIETINMANAAKAQRPTDTED